ncbi:hypothetical protein HL657_11430 [Methanoculleus sp. YWC-01]|uniref:Uncharacterized protein n=1 Tax=Methanoculleus nereidis TaxID=2735141 RepID=A0ABU3Z4N1_9EURY|nr:hypothetical protein [Methanoculleus sp. YWC-01]MDV4343767.1 hypothetical protein [Methanoculleus sp. YWC-01]
MPCALHAHDDQGREPATAGNYTTGATVNHSRDAKEASPGAPATRANARKWEGIL